MNYLDLYLQRNNYKRYDVFKKTGISQQLLSTHKNKKIEKYSSKVLIALAQTLEKTPGQVLDELISLEIKNPAFEAFNPQELLIGLKEKYDTIIISGAYYNEIYKLMKSNLTENETLGLELGSHGITTILAYAIIAVRDLFSNSDKIDLDIEKKLKLYKIKELTDNKLVLTLKQLDY